MSDKIYIAIPTFTGEINIATSLILIAWSHKYSLIIKPAIGLHPMDSARNTLVKDFLSTDCEYILWIDDDVVPPSNLLDRWTETLSTLQNIDILGAVCYSVGNDKGQYKPYPITLKRALDGRYKVHYGKGIEEVDATGGGCLMVHRKVYEALGKRPYQFKYNEDGIMNLTCDFHIWEKAKELGFKLFIDFDSKCDHQRMCSIKGFQDTLNG